MVPAHPGSPGKRAIKRVCVCVCVLELLLKVRHNRGTKLVDVRLLFSVSDGAYDCRQFVRHLNQCHWQRKITGRISAAGRSVQ